MKFVTLFQNAESQMMWRPAADCSIMWFAKSLFLQSIQGSLTQLVSGRSALNDKAQFLTYIAIARNEIAHFTVPALRLGAIANVILAKHYRFDMDQA